MKKIIITGVPEHFNYPWLQVINEQPFKKDGLELVWKNESKGSGAMNKALREGSTDLAIILTESFIKDKVEGNPGLIISWYVKSPLIWGVHTSAKSPENGLEYLKNFQFLISRYGSGSHLMAYLLAKRENWNLEKVQFEEIGNLEGAKQALQNEETKLFLWEKYTTKPLVDQGLFKRLGEIPTPWPCFVVVATPEVISEHSSKLEKLREMVFERAKSLNSNKESIKILSQYYGIKENDIASWLEITSWSEDNVMDAKDLEKVFTTLVELKILPSHDFKSSFCVDLDLVYLK
jgi:ABC-type nitrate/sulfonate/bicarbonate transport system substrate-binding protein